MHRSSLGLALLAMFVSAPVLALTASEQLLKDAATEFNKSARAPCIAGQACFSISNKYPASLPAPETYPWTGIDYRVDPEKYMQAVIGYVVEGNTSIDWNLDQNSVRKWYHAPWMHSEREPIHGMTSERGSRWHELGPKQERRTNNWAVGFYNAPGGYTIGKVWTSTIDPKAGDARFPVGTVSAKLLFTDATQDEAPYLYTASNLSWNAQITPSGTATTMRLLQVDVAVRESDSPEFSGWVFGTFVFDGSRQKPNYWENLVPVGLEWGNSKAHTYASFVAGELPKESWVNPYMKTFFKERAPDNVMGYLGRMNGPVDNPLSSCLSCHSRALDTKGAAGPAFTPTNKQLCVKTENIGQNQTLKRDPMCAVDEVAVANYYRNLKSDEPFIAGFESLDYSLQLAIGIAKFREWFSAHAVPMAAPGLPMALAAKTKAKKLLKPLPPASIGSITMVPATEAFRRGD